MAEYISKEAVINITAETGAWETQNRVRELPAADVQPVKHGRWLPSDSCITTAYGTIHCQICSECGADLMEDSDYDYDFCPNCGARMDGDT